ncbi:MAG: cytochrome c [Betaproteobacteria bacterium]|nr:cytochrome c [Betaproteobacteria bacterium]
MNKKLLAAGAALVLGAGFSLSALAQAKPDVMVKQRQAAMTLQGKYFGPLAGMAQGKVPFNANVVARNAEFLGALSQMPWDGFDASTSGVKSAALPAIWNDMAKFKSAQELLQGNVAKLVAASKGGNEGAIKAAIGDVGKSCGGCHDNFREKKQ